MAAENAIPQTDAYREVLLSETRRQRKTEKTSDWTTENARIADEPQDSYTPSDSTAARDTRLDESFRYSTKKKARYDIDKALGGIVGGDGDVGGGAPARKPHGGAAPPPPKTEAPEQPLTREEFLAKEKAVATDENSTVLAGTAERNEAGAGHPPTDPDELATSLEVTTRKAGKGATATIGSFNIEWLGKKARSDEDYKTIAQIVKDSGASLMGIQEVADVEGLKKVMQHLPGYGYVLGKSGDQMVGMIFDRNRVSYDASSIDLAEDITLGNPRMRPPLSVDVKVDNYDFNFTVLHLKAGFDEKALATRYEQADRLNEWARERLKGSPDKDMIIVGDYNDFVGSKTLDKVGNDRMFDFVTSEAGKGFYSNIRYQSIIDHAALSKEAGGAAEEFVPGSLRTIDESKYPSYKYVISDHKPVLFDVRSGVDND